MYWMLLPPSANAGRHIDDPAQPQNGSWGDFLHAGWGMILQLFAPKRG